MKTVYVGLSGGVDSSVAALLLKQQGYRVVGVYMKNWSVSLPGFACPWEQDYHDAKRIAVQLDIDFKMFDFEADYKHKVVDYMIKEYQLGNTPNPDIMCNQEIKFKLFLDTALENGADFIATGHYARIKGDNLLKAKDSNKDQSYFLYRTSRGALKKTIFPIGELSKPEVRQIAAKNNLITATKKESMGICFVGKVGIKDFLQNYVKTEPGPIVEQNGIQVGQHDGAIFYTIGQRHGLEVGGGLPYYVVAKDMQKNIVYVTTMLDDERLWRSELKLTNLHWINNLPEMGKTYQVRCRHRAPLINCIFDSNITNIKTATRSDLVATKSRDTSPHNLYLKLDDPIKAVTPGQSAVIYDGDVVLGGGIVV